MQFIVAPAAHDMGVTNTGVTIKRYYNEYRRQGFLYIAHSEVVDNMI